MASKSRRFWPVSALALLTPLALAACTAAPRPFPLREPLRKDTDLQSVRVPCHEEGDKKNPHHVSCAPGVYVSPLAWDGIDNSIFRPLVDVFAVDPGNEATNANSFDEVADSAWFTNTLGAHDLSLEELKAGACQPSELLAGESAPDGAWTIDKGKANGASLGFRVNIKGKGKYLFKTDPKGQPERATAASVIGAAAYDAVGFYTSCEQVVYFKPSVLKLTPGLRYENNSGIERDFDKKALQGVLDEATKRGEFVRMQASAWLPGQLIGPFRYEGTRCDDPNDVIPHEDRRELRGGRLLAAWINHFDAREQNSMDSWLADAGKTAPESSPGFVRHYYLDTSDSLGSEWDWDGISRRMSHSYLLDWGDIGYDFITLGIPTRPWERLKRTPGHEKFGYFDIDSFVPEDWKNEYPNPSFSHMTERDGAWMTRILARFTPEMVNALADIGRFSDPSDTAFIANVLNARLHKILDRYLTRLSPLTDVRVQGDTELCAFDLAHYRQLRSDGEFRYSARQSGGAALAAEPRPGHLVCVNVPHRAFDAELRADAAERYRVVSISNGVSPGPLLVHMYDLGAGHSFRVVGLERPAKAP
ncbi:MAG: hypothetical protein ABI548_28505 [Polyangiaceae bacterium]